MDDVGGKVALAGLIGLAVWQAIGEEGRRRVNNFLNEFARQAAMAAEKEAQERERLRREAEARDSFARLFAPGPLPSTSSQPQRLQAVSPGQVTVATPLKVAEAVKIVEPDARWRQVVVHPSVVLVLGKRGSGKSALGYRLLELFRFVASPYVVGVSSKARNLLPDWIGIAPSLGDVPPKAVVLVDEAYLAYHARRSMAEEAKAMSQLLNLSRQREQILVFVSQEARQVDRNIASSANVVIFKDLDMLQLEFDRPELAKLAAQAREAFTKLTGEKRRWSFVYAPDSDFLGPLENALPSFWKPALSHLFAADSSAATPRAAERLSPKDKAQKAEASFESGVLTLTIPRAEEAKRKSIKVRVAGK